MIKTLLICALGAFALAMISPAPAQSQAMTLRIKPLLHPLFSENAVLQRDRPLTIWGWTRAQADVTVKFDGAQRTLRADGEGYWSVPIRPRAAGGPYELEVSSAGQTQTRRNLMFGDVWLCSGQSNMEWPLSASNDAQAEIAAADFPQIRLLTVPKAVRSQPMETFESSWQVCSPQTVGEFSAVGYFFGRKLHRELGVPIGLVDSTWGGTVAQAWTSRPALETMGDFDGELAAMDDFLKNPVSMNEKMNAWWRNDAGTLARWEKIETDDESWNSIEQPGSWEQRGYEGFDGVMWLRREVEVPASWAGRDLKLSLGAIDDRDTTYWNGEEVGSTEVYNAPRDYRIAGGRVRAGRNVVAIRVLDTGGGGGLSGPAEAMFVSQGDEKLALSGAWKIRPSIALAELPALPVADINQNTPTTLYNGMIAPLLPGQIKGAIWYQGESNAGNPIQYRTLLPTMIGDWRARFGEPLPFYIVQLANFLAPDEQPGAGGWAMLREAQSLTARNVPDTGLAVAIDIGEQNDIHPRNKQDVGLRLALQALKNTYGQKIQADGPTLQRAEGRGGEIALTFDHADGLMLKGEADRVFAIAGANKKFVWVTPQIVGKRVILSSPAVANPLYVRFGWSNNPRASLYNSAGLPASPFRTDE